MSTDPVEEPPPAADEDTLARLAAIDNHVQQIATGLGDALGEFNGQLEKIHAALETVIGFVTPEQINESY